MKSLVAGLLTAVILGLLFWSGLRDRSGTNAPAAASSDAAVNPAVDPVEDRIRNLLDRSREADVSGYLEAFTGPLRDRLEREINERGREAFAEDLRTAAASRKSHAMFAPEFEGPDSARIVVEAVYLDRNERQTYRLERKAAGWFVADVETVKSRQPKEKYGTPAVYNAPEGVPVQGGGVTVETGEEGIDTLPGTPGAER